MRYFLDTNICIFAMKGRYPGIKRRLSELRPYQVKIPAMVKAELLLGALKSAKPVESRAIVDRFLAPFEISAFDDAATEVYARIRGAVEKAGRPIGPNDVVIAATALTHDATLVTNNSKEFSRVQGLKIEDWTTERSAGLAMR